MSRALLKLLHPATFLALVLLVVAGGLTYRVGKDRLVANVYRDRLAALHEDYNALADRYNRAVTRAAVTELEVTETSVAVVVRSPDGVLETIATPYDPADEIFLDYAVIDGRLWVRRVFDENTPPNQGTLIDPALADIDWDEAAADHGKAAYRSLSPGRWRVAVSGDGSVTLRAAPDDADAPLVRAPAVRDFDPVEQAAADIGRISAADVVGQLWP